MLMPCRKIEVTEYQCAKCSYKWINWIKGKEGPKPKRCSNCKRWVAKGKNNFICAVKEDFIRNGTYKCGSCLSNECYHTSADYGPCINNVSFRLKDCRYRTFPEDYGINNKGTREEQVFIDNETRNNFQKKYSQWSYLEN